MRKITITFTPAEEELYQWALSKASMRNKYRRGISEFVKDVLWSIYIAEKTAPVRRWMFIVKESLNSARCDTCGGRLTVCKITDDGVELYCNRCDEHDKTEGTSLSGRGD